MSNKKTVLITGATSGIGLETAKDLALRGYRVIGTSRSTSKEKEALHYIGQPITFIQADLTSQKHIKRIAEQTKKLLNGAGLDVLINNAGTFYSHFSLSPEGIEKQFAVNTVAPLYLSLLLFDALKKANGRIINVTSSSHYRTNIRWSDLQLSRHYSQLRAYKQTKLFSVMLSREFNKRSGSVKTYMADPGLVATNIGFKNTGFLARLVWRMRKSKGQTVAQGAETSVYLSSKPELADAFYWKGCRPQPPSMLAMNEENSKKIWDYCADIMDIDAAKVLGE